MKYVTNLLINDFHIKQIGCDFMGYTFKGENELSFHHLIIPRRLCKKRNIPNEGYTYDNGCILRQISSHNYLHLIEKVDIDRFAAITSEMIDEKALGRLDIQNIKRIHDILTSFEKEYSGITNKNGKPLIKQIYTERKKI